MNSRMAARRLFEYHKGIVDKGILDKASDRIIAEVMGTKDEKQKSIFPETVLMGLRQSTLSAEGLEKKHWLAIKNGVLTVYEDVCTFDVYLSQVLPAAIKKQTPALIDRSLPETFTKAHGILIKSLLSKRANPAAYVRAKALGSRIVRVLTRLEATANNAFKETYKSFNHFYGDDGSVSAIKMKRFFNDDLKLNISDDEFKGAIVDGKVQGDFLFKALAKAADNLPNRSEYSTLKKQIKAIVDPANGLFVEYITIVLDSIDTYKRKVLLRSKKSRQSFLDKITVKDTQIFNDAFLASNELESIANKSISTLLEGVDGLPDIFAEPFASMTKDDLLNDPDIRERDFQVESMNKSVSKIFSFGVAQRKTKGRFFSFGVWRKAKSRELDLKGSSDDIKTSILESAYVIEVAEEYLLKDFEKKGYKLPKKSDKGNYTHTALFTPDGDVRKVYEVKQGNRKTYFMVNKDDLANIKTPVTFDSLAEAKKHVTSLSRENALLLKNPYVVQDLAKRNLPQITPDLEAQLFGDVVYKSLNDNASANSITRVYPTRKIELDGYVYNVVTEGRFKNHILEFLVNAAGKQIEGSKLDYSGAFSSDIGTGENFGKFTSSQRKGSLSVSPRVINKTIEVDGQKVTVEGNADVLALEPFFSTYEGGPENDTKLFLTLPTDENADGLLSPYADLAMRQSVANFVAQFCPDSINISANDEDKTKHATYLVDPSDYAKLRDFLGSCAMTKDASGTVEAYYNNLRRFVAATSEDNLSFYSAEALNDINGAPYFKPGVMLNNMQRKAIAWMEENGFRGVMGLGTGVGKTLLSAVSAYMILENKFKEGGDGSNGRILYVQPKALVGNLTGELEALTNIPKSIGNIGRDVLSLQIADASAMSLEALRSDSPRRAFDEIAYETFDAMPQDDIDRYSAILFDEAQNLNPVNELAKTRARKATLATTENKILLTASTMEESPQDLFNLVSITNGQDLFPDSKLKAKEKDGLLFEDLHIFKSDSASDKRRKTEIQRILTEKGINLAEISYRGKITYSSTAGNRGHIAAIRDMVEGKENLNPRAVKVLAPNGKKVLGTAVKVFIKRLGKENLGAIARELGTTEELYTKYMRKNSPMTAYYDNERLLNPITSRNLKVAENFQENYATRIGSRWVGINPDPIKKREFLTWVSTNAFFANKLDVDFEEINKPALASIDQETVTLSMSPKFEATYKRVAKEISSSLNNLALYFKDGRVDQEGLAELKPAERKELFSEVNKVSRKMKILNELNLRPQEGLRKAAKINLVSKDDAQAILNDLRARAGTGGYDIDVGYKSFQAAELAQARMREGAGLSRSIFFADDPKTVHNHAQFMSLQKGMTDAYHVAGTAKDIVVYQNGKAVKVLGKPSTTGGAKKLESEINNLKVKSLGFSEVDGKLRPPAPSSFKTYKAKAKSASPKGALALVREVLTNASKVKEAWLKVSEEGSKHKEIADSIDPTIVAGILNLNRKDYGSLTAGALNDNKLREEVVIDALSQRDKNLANRGVIEKILNPPIPQTSLEDREDEFIILKANSLDLNIKSKLDPKNPKAFADKRSRKPVIKKIREEEKKRAGINAGNWQKKIIESLFVKDPACGVVTVTLTGKEGKKGGSAGFSKGFNLQTFDTVIHLDRNSWSSEEMEQRRGRAWRTGQADRVQEYTIDLVFANEKDYVTASEQNKKVDGLTDTELVALSEKMIADALAPFKGVSEKDLSDAKKKAKAKAESMTAPLKAVLVSSAELPKAVKDNGGDEQAVKSAFNARMDLEVALKTFFATQMDSALEEGSSSAGLVSSVDTIRKYLEQSDSDLFAQVIQGSTQLVEADEDGEADLGAEFFKSQEKVGGKAVALQNDLFIGALSPIGSELKKNDEVQKQINADPIRSLNLKRDAGRFNQATISVGGAETSPTELMDENSPLNQEVSRVLDGLGSVPTTADLIDMAGFNGLKGIKGAMSVDVSTEPADSTKESVLRNVKVPEGMTIDPDSMVSVGVKGFNSPFSSMERVYYKMTDAEGNVKLGMYNASLRFQDNDCIPDGALDRLFVSQIKSAEEFGITKIDCDPKTEAKAALCAYGFSSKLSPTTVGSWKNSLREIQGMREKIVEGGYSKLAEDPNLLRKYYEAVMYCMISGRNTRIGYSSFGDFRSAVYKKTVPLKDSAGNPVLDSDGKPKKTTENVEGMMFALKQEIDASLNAGSLPEGGVRGLVDFFLDALAEADGGYTYKSSDFTDEQVVDEYNRVFQSKEGRRGALNVKLKGVPKLKMAGKKGENKVLAWAGAGAEEKAKEMFAKMNIEGADPVEGLSAFLNKTGEAKSEGVIEVLSPDEVSYQKVREIVAVHSKNTRPVKAIKALMRGHRSYFDAYVALTRSPIKTEEGTKKFDIELDDLSLDLSDSEDNLSRRAIEEKMLKDLKNHRGNPNRWLNANLKDYASTKDCEDKARAGQFPWVTKTAALSIDDYIRGLDESEVVEEVSPVETLLNINDFVSKLNNKGDCFRISPESENEMNEIFNDLAEQRRNEEILNGVIGLVQYKAFK